jgi:hypothetical protein
MRPRKFQLSMKSPLNLRIILLILLRQNPMSNEEIQHKQRTIWLEFPFAQSFLHLFYCPEIELLDFRIIRFRDHVSGKLEIIDVFTLWLDQPAFTSCSRPADVDVGDGSAGLSVLPDKLFRKTRFFIGFSDETFEGVLSRSNWKVEYQQVSCDIHHIKIISLHVP